MTKKEKRTVGADKLSSHSDYSRFFKDSFGVSPYPEFDNSEEIEYDIHIVSSPTSAKEEILTKRNIREEFHAYIDSIDDDFLPEAFKAAKDSEFALPQTAPVLWEDRDRNKREKCIDFVRNTYGKWLGLGLRRADLQKLDPSLYRTLSTFYSRNGIPDDLAVLETDHGKITSETLENLGIKSPKDALLLFKEDGVVAQRYYQAARRLSM